MKLRPIVLSIGMLLVTGGMACGNNSDDGPLDSGSESGYAQLIDVGVPFSIGLPLIGNLGDRDGIVEEVRLVGVTGPLEVLGLRTRPYPDDGPTLSFGMYGFPPTEKPSHDPSKVNVVIGSPNLTPGGTPEDVLQLAGGCVCRQAG